MPSDDYSVWVAKLFQSWRFLVNPGASEGPQNPEGDLFFG